MSRILIYGGQGYVGRHVIEKLHKQHDIFNISPSKSKRNNLSYTHISGQLWNNISKIKQIKPEYFIIIFFGNPKVESAHLYERIIGSISRIDKILKNVNFIFISSQLVYGGKHPSLKSESDKLFPISVYAKKCWKMEKLLISSINNSYVILRVPILYGNNIRADGYKNMVNSFISVAEEGESIKIYGNGDQVRTLLHIEDLADLINKIIKMGIQREIINASTGDFLSVIKIARMIARRFNVGVVSKLEWPKKELELESVDIKLNYKKTTKFLEKKLIFKQYINSTKL